MDIVLGYSSLLFKERQHKLERYARRWREKNVLPDIMNEDEVA